MFGKVYYGAKEDKTQKDLLLEFLDETEKSMMKMLYKGLAMSGCGIPDELDQESIQFINDSIKAWQKTKNLCVESLEISERKESELKKKLEDQQKQLDKQSEALKRIESMVGKIYYRKE